jgi:serine/threonine-protein kinase
MVMARKGPLVTLLGGGALAAVLLTLSANAASQDAASREAANAAAEAPAAEATEGPSTAQEEVPDEEPAEPAADEPVVTYTGWVDGGGVSVAIAVQGELAIAYVCDGAQLEAWLEGTASGGELSLEGAEGEQLGGTYDGEAASGSVSAGGRNFTFEAEFAAAPAGLYRFADTVDGAEVVAGWIELPNGEQIGGLDVEGIPGPVSELDVATLRAEILGESVTATVATPTGAE